MVRLLNVNIAQHRTLHENEVCAENAAAVSRYVLQRHISAPRDFQPHAAVRNVDVPHRQIIAFHGNQTARIRRNSQVVLSDEVVIRPSVDGAVRNLVRREVFGIFPGFAHARQHRFASALIAQRVTGDTDADLTERAAANCAFLHAAQPNRRRDVRHSSSPSTNSQSSTVIAWLTSATMPHCAPESGCSAASRRPPSR